MLSRRERSSPTGRSASGTSRSLALALVARPDEDAGRTQLEAAEPAELDLERALGADELAGALVAPEQRHAPSIRLEM